MTRTRSGGVDNVAEIKRDPISTTDEDDDIVYAFDANHTLADIARWIMRNPVDAETVRDMLTEMLEGEI